jgi:hypothetical protein
MEMKKAQAQAITFDMIDRINSTRTYRPHTPADEIAAGKYWRQQLRTLRTQLNMMIQMGVSDGQQRAEVWDGMLRMEKFSKTFHNLFPVLEPAWRDLATEVRAMREEFEGGNDRLR